METPAIKREATELLAAMISPGPPAPAPSQPAPTQPAAPEGGRRMRELPDVAQELADLALPRKCEQEKDRKRKRGQHNHQQEQGQEKTYEVRMLVGQRQTKQGRTEYKVRWEGYCKGDDTWEPEDNLRQMTYFESFVEQWKERAGKTADGTPAVAAAARAAQGPAFQRTAKKRRRTLGELAPKPEAPAPAAAAAAVPAAATAAAATAAAAAAAPNGEKMSATHNATAAADCDLCCDTCDGWFRASNVGLSVREAETLQEWHCAACLGQPQPQPQQGSDGIDRAAAVQATGRVGHWFVKAVHVPGKVQRFVSSEKSPKPNACSPQTRTRRLPRARCCRPLPCGRPPGTRRRIRFWWRKCAIT